MRNVRSLTRRVGRSIFVTGRWGGVETRRDRHSKDVLVNPLANTSLEDIPLSELYSEGAFHPRHRSHSSHREDQLVAIVHHKHRLVALPTSGLFDFWGLLHCVRQPSTVFITLRSSIIDRFYKVESTLSGPLVARTTSGASRGARSMHGELVSSRSPVARERTADSIDTS